MTDWRVIESDCIEAMAAMPESSVDAIVSDPPYGLGFMGREWDNLPPGLEWSRECLRVLKPGGHLLAFGGTRTYHRLTCALEDGGFEIRDCLAWLHGSGFPKSHNIGNGLGTALKPAHEPIVMARKPLAGTVQHNWQTHGTGPLNIDGCRIEGTPRDPGNLTVTANGNGITHGHMTRDPANYVMPSGRWPANVLLDKEAAALLDEQTGECRSAGEYVKGARVQGAKAGAASIPVDGLTSATYSDAGGASRFFYVAKASSAERNAGLDGFEEHRVTTLNAGVDGSLPRNRPNLPRANVHPTVKPIDLMRWLCRLITPPGGTVLDPFAGSGTTGCAAALEGFDFIGIEREAEYAAIARARIAHWWKQPVQLNLEAA